MDFSHPHDHDLQICHVKKGVMCETNTVWLRRFELSILLVMEKKLSYVL